MKRKKLIRLTGALLLVLIALVFYLGYHFYFVFGNSHQLFRLRHSLAWHLEGYTDRWSYYPGDSVSVYVSSRPGGHVAVSIFSVAGQDTLVQGQSFPAAYQGAGAHPAVTGAGWERSYQVRLPDSCVTGWYALQLKKGSQVFHCSIFIRPKPDRVRKKIVILFSTNTWNAYNYWGGQSLYTRNYTPDISFLRPQLLADPFLVPSIDNLSYAYQAANKDRYLADWLHQSGYEVDAYSMTDLHEDAEWLKNYTLAIISTHAEYWTPKMMDHLNEFLDAGGSLFSLSGNTAAWVSHLSASGQQLTVYKKGGKGLWMLEKAYCRPFGTDIFFTAMHTYAPYRVTADTSWVFAGTSLQSGDLFGTKSDTYDPTHMYASQWGNLKNLFQWQKMTMASGMEIDQVRSRTPDTWISVAKGLNPAIEGQGTIYPDPAYDWEGSGGAHMGYYLHPGGGMVFNVSSMAFTGAIPYDANIRQVMHNVIEKIIGPKNRREANTRK